jgi:hypothetical protein
MHRLAVLSALWILAAGAHAQVYKCIDANGKTIYMQSSCPAGDKSKAISRTVPPAPAAPAAGGAADKAGKSSGPKTAAELEQDFRTRRQEEEKQREKEDQKLADAKERENNCRNAKARVLSLDSGIRPWQMNEKGEPAFLDEAQIERESANARKAAEQWCK